jgi:molybdopterin/thiamine biosynthesis adenylyltransferase
LSLPPLVEPAAELTVDEVRRYSRHLIIPDVGMTGQKRLKNAKVLCVGAGGLGSPALLYLAAAGVGTLGIVDFDVVDESNLQRQVIHGQSDIGRSKAESARDSIREINPYVNVIVHKARLDSDNAMQIFSDYDLIVDGTDNFATRYLVNDACVLLGKPYVWGSIYRFDGQASVFWAEYGPCYRCLYPEPPPPGMVPSCAEGGVLGVLCASIGSIQVNEAIKVITGIGEPLAGRLMIYDALEMTYRSVKVRKDPECPVCGKNPSSAARCPTKPRRPRPDPRSPPGSSRTCRTPARTSSWWTCASPTSTRSSRSRARCSSRRASSCPGPRWSVSRRTSG